MSVWWVSVIVWIPLAWMPLAWADYQVAPGIPVDLGELLLEFRNVGITLDGASCADNFGTVVCQRVPEDFTDADKMLMDAVVAGHDAKIRSKRKAQHETRTLALWRKLCQGTGLTIQECDELRESVR